MKSTLKAPALGFAIGLTVIVLASSVFAFCRQKTCEEITCGPRAADGCVDKVCERDAQTCIIEGTDLFYQEPCLKFAVESGAGEALGLTDAEFEDVVVDAFDRWQKLDCGNGVGPGFEVTSAGVVPSKGNFFCKPLPEVNLSVWRFSKRCLSTDESAECWGHSDLSLGYTTSTFAVETGEVFDADVELNIDRIRSSFPVERMRDVILSIATHEAGHFLGIAHSDNDEAIMATSYSDAALLAREFHEDDVQAICAAYPPQGAPVACSEPGSSDAALNQEACDVASQVPASSNCSVRSAPSGGAASWWVALGLALLLTRRRSA